MEPTTTQPDALIRLPEVMRLTGLSKTAIYRRAKSGAFPQQIPLGDSEARQAGVAWSQAEVAAWIEQRKNARTATAA